MPGATVLLAYHTFEGQAGKIAERIAAKLVAMGINVDVLDANAAPSPLGFDGVILGDSIHLMQHSQSLTRYASRHADELSEVPLALFQVSLTSANHDQAHAVRAQELVHELCEEAGIDPDLVGLFAGALAYTQYGWLKRRVMRRVVMAEIGETDISTDHEFTDWDAVDRFAADMADLIGRSSVDGRPSRSARLGSMDHLPEAVRAALETDQIIDITTTGRRSGNPSRIEIWFLNLVGTVYIMGAPGRDWFANLGASPELVFHLKQTIEADLPATAEVIDDPELRRQVFAAAVAAWELDGDTFDESTKHAPLVRITFPGPIVNRV